MTGLAEGDVRGGAREKNGRFYARARYGRGKRLERRVPWAKSLEEAEARGHLIAKVADQLCSVGRRDLVANTAEELAFAANERRLASVMKAVQVIIGGAKRIAASHDITFEEWSRRYTSGELAAEYPDYVKARDHSDDLSRLRDYILPHVRDVPVASFDLAHAQLVMSKLPKMSTANRRQVAQIIGRLMHLAVLPGRIIKATPLPRGWLPKVTSRRHYSFLYPREEAMLLRHSDTSECFRLFCGVLNREGMRLSELLDGDWWQWNLEEGTFQATKTKTGDPRFWAVDAGTVAAMRIWKRRSGAEELERSGKPAPKPFAYVLELVGDDRTKIAQFFRASLKAAGVTRKELFETTAHTGRLRAHDMRATFVTVSLAEGKSETWIRDRTAHKSTSMIDRYRRSARQLVELKLGALVNLVQALGWGSDGGKALGEEVFDVDGGEANGAEPVIETTTQAEVAEWQTQRIQNPVSSSEPLREVLKHRGKTTYRDAAKQASPTLPPPPLAPPHAVAGGTAPDVDSSTPIPAELEPLAVGLALERAQWDAFDELAEACVDAGIVAHHEIDEIVNSPSRTRPPKKALPRPQTAPTKKRRGAR